MIDSPDVKNEINSIFLYSWLPLVLYHFQFFIPLFLIDHTVIYVLIEKWTS